MRGTQEAPPRTLSQAEDVERLCWPGKDLSHCMIRNAGVVVSFDRTLTSVEIRWENADVDDRYKKDELNWADYNCYPPMGIPTKIDTNQTIWLVHDPEDDEHALLRIAG